MVQFLFGVSLVLHLTPWPILIYFLRGDARDLSICVLGNNRPLCPPSKQALIFFFLPFLDSIFFLLVFAATSSRLNRFGSPSGFQSSKTGFPCPLFSIPLHLLSLPNLSLLHSYIYMSSHLFLVHWVISRKKKALKVCLESFWLEKRQALWVEKTFEHLPRRRKALPNN